MARDVVCGMTVDEATALTSQHAGCAYFFCSALCRDSFARDPSRYLAAAPSVGESSVARAARIAYFSMEIGIETGIPTYSGGLGVLAGDTLKACADMRVPVVGVTLLYHQGYFRQIIDEQGSQRQEPVQWQPQARLRRLPQTVELQIEGRPVKVGCWQYDILGATGSTVPVLFLDTALPENAPQDQRLTDALYGGDQRYRLSQEVVLGIGGVRILRALGLSEIQRFHMNEGHAALLVLERLEASRANGGPWDFDSVRGNCVFTTHTPVPAGHDRFDYALVRSVLGESYPLDLIQMLAGSESLNMTLLALNISHYVNGVAKRHGEVSREMFPGYPIASITNGVHSYTWTGDSFRALYDRHIPAWRADPWALRYSLGIPKAEVWNAHVEAKRKLIDRVNQTTHAAMDPDVLTVGFARRATPYKRTALLFTDLNWLRWISKQFGRLQFVFAGKAHPRDEGGKAQITRVLTVARELAPDVLVTYLPDYDMEMARTLVSGVDVWLNTPRKPMEASGTSGMKAAHNGVPSLSVLDGWWLEGHIEGLTGWSIGTSDPKSGEDAAEASELYKKLQDVIVPLYYHSREGWIDIMRHTIALNASFFNTHRMVQQYVTNAYL